MRLIATSCRGLLGGWLVAATMPLLLNPRAIATWTATGLGDPLRIALAAAELSGAVLFAFEKTVVPGFVVLLASFAVAFVIHAHHGEFPWLLVAYTAAAAGLQYVTRREMHAA